MICASALVLLLGAVPHPNSLSLSELVLNGSEARLRIRVQVLSLEESFGELDLDGDGLWGEAESVELEGPILTYIEERYRISTGTARDLTGGELLIARTGTLRRVPSDRDAPFGFWDWFEAELTYTASAPIRDIQIEADLFWETSPDHTERTELVWSDGSTEQFILDTSRPVARSDPEGKGAFPAFARHVLVELSGRWEWLALAAALIAGALGAGGLRPGRVACVLSALITGLAVGSVATAHGHVDLAEWTQLAGLASVLAVAYAACDGWMQPGRERAPWIEALVLGGAQGLFAGVAWIRPLAEERAPVAATIGAVTTLAAIALVAGILTALLVGIPMGRMLRKPVLVLLAVAGFAGFALRI